MDCIASARVSLWLSRSVIDSGASGPDWTGCFGGGLVWAGESSVAAKQSEAARNNSAQGAQNRKVSMFEISVLRQAARRTVAGRGLSGRDFLIRGARATGDHSPRGCVKQNHQNAGGAGAWGKQKGRLDPGPGAPQ
jgi:hypothetical protein